MADEPGWEWDGKHAVAQKRNPTNGRVFLALRPFEVVDRLNLIEAEVKELRERLATANAAKDRYWLEAADNYDRLAR